MESEVEPKTDESSRSQSEHEADPLYPYYSEKLKKYFIFSFNIGSWTGTHPYYYDKSQDLFRKVTGAKLWLSYFNAVVALSNYGFLLSQIYRALKDPNADLGTQLLLIYMLAYYTFPTMYQVAFVMIGNEICVLSNAFLTFYKEFGRVAVDHYYTENAKLKEIKLAELISRNNIVSFNTMTLFFAGYALADPSQPFLLSSLLENPSGTDLASLAWRTFSFLNTLYQEQLFHANALWITTQMFGICASFVPALRHLREAELQNGEWLEQMKWYTQMRLLMASYNRCYGAIIYPVGSGIMLTFGVYAVYAALRLSGIMQLALIGTGLVAYSLLISELRSLAEINTQSEDLLQQWKCQIDSPLARRMVRMQRPLRVEMSVNYVDVPIVLTVTEMTIDNAITLLFF